MHVVIVGAGHGGGHLAATLARTKVDVSVTLVGDEDYPPYQRPPLSKAYLSGQMNESRLYLRPAAYYEKANVERIESIAATSIQKGAHCINLADGRQITYDKLVLATGGSPRKLNLPGSDLPGVHTLRTIADVEAMRERFSNAQSIVIIGGGYIGLEVAAVARKAGKAVHVIEKEDRLLARVATQQTSQFFRRLHEEEGTQIHLNTGVQSISGTQSVENVQLLDDSHLDADLVLIAVGIEPNIALAEGADIVCDNGILVNEYGLTSDPDVYALGDCANMMNLALGRFVRLESVQNAVDAANVVAAHLLGETQPYSAIPWFWSDQFDVKFQSVGLPLDYDEAVARGADQSGRSFSY
ncbi:MAG: FAD-dependent oxidoreductase, partial [Sphingomonadales bacterium]